MESIGNLVKYLKGIVILLIIILLVVSVVGFKILSNSFKKDIYKVDSRVSSIKKEQKKDNYKYYRTISWLRVQGTNIDTPIINFYGDISEKELEKNNNDDHYIDKENYLWNDEGQEKLYNKVNIMGHNILNLSSKPDVGLKYFSRFDDLMSFVYYDFVKDNKYIQYTIDGKDYIYKIYSVEFINVDKLDLYADSNYSKKQLDKYIDKSKTDSIYDFDIDVNNSDKIISLITCTRFFGDDDQIDFRINARMIRDNEKYKNYGVKKNKNYKKIEKVLKGEKDEEV